jgi:subtilase family serine protease
VADVSAVADPNTGVAVLYGGLWFTVGGTSASSPIIASVYALAGNASTVNAGSYPYSHTTGLFDVTTGSNGTCSPSYLCHGQTGYDGPTGLGTPNGVSGF